MKFVEEVVRIDKQGRIVIPAKIRRLLGIDKEISLVIRIEGSRIILEPLLEDLDRAVNKWVEATLSTKPKPKMWKMKY